MTLFDLAKNDSIFEEALGLSYCDGLRCVKRPFVVLNSIILKLSNLNEILVSYMERCQEKSKLIEEQICLDKSDLMQI